MNSRSDLDALLRELEMDLPDMKTDLNNFNREFEDRSEIILGVAASSDQPYVLDCLTNILRRAGISGITPT
jgi:hypothetical protein